MKSDLLIGLDIGNGAVKACVQGDKRYLPAYFVRTRFRPQDLPAFGFIEYLEGTHTPESDRWFAGATAFEQSPENLLRVTDHPENKVKLSLEALLGVVSNLDYAPAYNLSIVASIHDAEVYGLRLQAALTGECIAKFNDYPTATKIKHNCLMVREEGHAAVAFHRDKLDLKSQNLVLDIGNGTVICSLFGQSGRLAERKSFPRAGVQSLIEQIAASPDIRQLLGETANPQIIRSGIEEGSFEYGSTGQSFRAIYDKCLRLWAESNLAPAMRFLKPWKAIARGCLAIGGGCKLPGIEKALTANGFTVSPDPVWANALGLYQVANIIFQQRGVA